MPLVKQKYITRKDLKDNPDVYYVFGDNLMRKGLGGQAKEMRGEPNAVGLPTKYGYQRDAYLDDSYEKIIEKETQFDILKLREQIREGGTVVWPEDNIGTGRAKLREKAPKIADFYGRVLTSLKYLSCVS